MGPAGHGPVLAWHAQRPRPGCGREHAPRASGRRSPVGACRCSGLPVRDPRQLCQGRPCAAGEGTLLRPAPDARTSSLCMRRRRVRFTQVPTARTHPAIDVLYARPLPAADAPALARPWTAAEVKHWELQQREEQQAVRLVSGWRPAGAADAAGSKPMWWKARPGSQGLPPVRPARRGRGLPQPGVRTAVFR